VPCEELGERTPSRSSSGSPSCEARFSAKGPMRPRVTLAGMIG
jgi:hypothetical protein